MGSDPDEIGRWPRLTPDEDVPRMTGRGEPGPGVLSGLFRAFRGPILIMASLYALLFWYGSSTMIDPSLPHGEWLARWSAGAFSGELLVAFTLGLGLLACGFWLTIRDFRRRG